VEEYTATVYAVGLSAPDGLAIGPDGTLYVAEEKAGRVSQVGPSGDITPVIVGLASPEGIAFDGAGNLYVVEDVSAGRLVQRTPDGTTTTLVVDLDAPEGIASASDGTLYVTESNTQFTTDPAHLRSRVAVASSSGTVTRIMTNTPTISGTDVTFWSYAGLTLGPDGLLYVTNELSGQEITRTVVIVPGVLTLTFGLSGMDSIFTIDPATGDRALFASDLLAPEGLRFSAGGGFPLYVAEEDVGGGAGRLSRIEPDGSHAPFCTGFFSIEDVAVDQEGWLYVSEDASGLIILIRPRRRVWLPVVLRHKESMPGAFAALEKGEILR
jgi:glucose/arabinose dehydrogenase